MNTEKIVKEISRLAIASDSFKQCLALLGHMIKLKLDFESEIYPPMMCGVVTCYGRNFNSSAGLGPLPSFYEKFSENHLEISHKSIINARNKFYAHRDVKDIKNYGESSSVPYSIEMRLKPSMDGFNFTPILVDIPPERIPDMVELLEFQINRLVIDLSKKNKLITDFDKSYDLDKVYILGKDFP